MATDRQIAANRLNSKRSTGPTSDTGKARSRLNATKHGMASELPQVEAGFSPGFDDRRAKWAVSFPTVDEYGEWAFDRVVSASFRIERCEKAVEKHIIDVRQRAALAWDQDREVEAARIFGRLTRDPILASRQLQTTLAGVVLLIEAWLLLAAPLEAHDEWSEADCSKALDMLGIAADLRSGRMRIDAPEGTDSIAFRLNLASDEIDRLEALREEALIPLDEMERDHAMSGDIALFSSRAKLLLRYEREAWKHYNDSMKVVREQVPTTPPVAAPTPATVAARPAKVREPAASGPSRSMEEERRALRAEAAPYVKALTDQLVAEGFVDEDAWLEELERRLETRPAYSVPEQSRSGGVAVDRPQFGDRVVGREVE